MNTLTQRQAGKAGFKLLDVIAAGGSSTVYKARYNKTGKRVALKLLDPGISHSHIQREARAMSKLLHPNIAHVIDAGKIGQVAYLATRWIDASPLRDILKSDVSSHQFAQDIELILKPVHNIADALQYAHHNGVIHADLSPNNILVSANRTATIIDFGIARITSENTVTAIGELSGTPRYLAPEIIQGHSPQARSDQYAFALIIYEMLTGRWPYPQDKPIAAVALHHQLYTQPIPISELRPDLPASVDEVFSRALSKCASQRFDDVSTFHSALVQSVYCKGNETHNSSSALINNNAALPSVFQNIRLKQVLAISALCLMVLVIIELQTAEKNSHVLRQLNAQADSSDTTLSDRQTHSADATCNLYKNSTFDHKLEDNFFQDSQRLNLATRVQLAEHSSMPVLQLGDIDLYGSYGVIVDVIGGNAYSFSADLQFREYVHRMDMYIIWLDERWQPIENRNEILHIKRTVDDTYVLSNAVAPQAAHFAVPALYKDASSGFVFADNVTFTALDQPCHQR